MHHPSSSSRACHRLNVGAARPKGIVAAFLPEARARLLALACCALLSTLAACSPGATGTTATETATPTLPAATATATPAPQASLSIYFLSITGNGSANTVYALDPANGKPRWSHAMPASSARMLAAANGIVYVIGSGGAITALRVQDGSQIWRITGHTSLLDLPLAADGAVLFVGSQGYSTHHGYIDAYRAADGQRLWEHDEGLDTGAALAASGGVLYASNGKTLSALRESDGGTLWQQSVTASGIQPFAIGGSVYLNNSGEVYAFDATSGSPLWHYKPSTLASPSDETVSACAGLILAGNGVKLNALRAADGSLAWSNTYRHIFYGTSCYDGVAYVSPSPDPLLALNAASGAQTWSASLQGREGAAPVLSGGMLYESRADTMTDQPNGYVYALNPATGAVVWKYAQSGASFTQIIVM